MAFHAIVLAGGEGSRFGGRKLLAPWKSGVLLDGALGAALWAPVEAVWIVTGAYAQPVEAAARRFAERQGASARLHVVHAPDHREGMAASLRAGIRALPETATGAFIFLGDMPSVPAAIPHALAERAQMPGILAAAPICEGRRGHPVLVSRSLFPNLVALEGDAGAGKLLDGIGHALSLVPTPDQDVLLDVDTEADLAAIVARAGVRNVDDGY